MSLPLVFSKIFILLGTFFLCVANTQLYAASYASAGMDEGYSANVLEKILKTVSITQTLGKAKEIRLLLTLDGEGKLTGCTVRKSSSIKGVDEELCHKIRQISSFGAPPYAQPAEITLAFFNGSQPVSPSTAQTAETKAVTSTASQTSQTAKVHAAQEKTTLAQNEYPQNFQNYLKKITWQIRNSMYIPQESKPGTYYATARIKLDKQGKILDSSILTSSGDKIMDKYVLQGIKRARQVPPPPNGLNDNIDLTFQLVR